MSKPKSSFNFDELLHQTWRAAEEGKLGLDADDTLIGERIATAKATAEIEKKVPFAMRAAQEWKTLAPKEKVNAGIWGAGAVLGAYGALSAAHYAVGRDEDHKMHVQWSQVGISLVQAAVAAGCAFMAVEAVHGRG